MISVQFHLLRQLDNVRRVNGQTVLVVPTYALDDLLADLKLLARDVENAAVRFNSLTFGPQGNAQRDPGDESDWLAVDAMNVR